MKKLKLKILKKNIYKYIAHYESCTDILIESYDSLKARTKLPDEQIKKIISTVSNAVYSNHSKSALEIYKELNFNEKLTWGDKILDDIFQGGLSTRSGIIEIVGESAVGKSQMALQLCLNVQLPKHLGGLEGGKYICEIK